MSDNMSIGNNYPNPNSEIKKISPQQAEELLDSVFQFGDKVNDLLLGEENAQKMRDAMGVEENRDKIKEFLFNSHTSPESLPSFEDIEEAVYEGTPGIDDVKKAAKEGIDDCIENIKEGIKDGTLFEDIEEAMNVPDIVVCDGPESGGIGGNLGQGGVPEDSDGGIAPPPREMPDNVEDI